MNVTHRWIVPVAAVLVAALCGCKRREAIDRVVEEQSPGLADSGQDPVKLDVSAETSDVALGDDIVFHVKLTNTGRSAVQVNRPRIDRRSVTMRVRRPDGSIASVERNWAELSQTTGQFVYDAPEAVNLDAGGSLDQKVPTVAIQAGKLAFTLAYLRQGAPAALVAKTVEVTVAPAKPKEPRLGVRLETSHGAYTAVLRPDVAYDTVESFASLVKKGFYDGLKFHRILRGFMAQGGDPKGNGSGGPGYCLPLDANPSQLPHRRGVLSMARNPDPYFDSAGSQFFILFRAAPDLDEGRYTTFGEMVDGEDTLNRLEAVGAVRDPMPPKEPVVIQHAQLVTLP